MEKRCSFPTINNAKDRLLQDIENYCDDKKPSSHNRFPVSFSALILEHQQRWLCDTKHTFFLCPFLVKRARIPYMCFTCVCSIAILHTNQNGFLFSGLTIYSVYVCVSVYHFLSPIHIRIHAHVFTKNPN